MGENKEVNFLLMPVQHFCFSACKDNNKKAEDGLCDVTRPYRADELVEAINEFVKFSHELTARDHSDYVKVIDHGIKIKAIMREMKDRGVFNDLR